MHKNFVRKTGAAVGLIAILIVGLARPSEAFFDKTRFVTDLGVAYFCFHHWVSNPYREGKFTAGAPHRTGSIIKAGAALLFAVNRVKAANRIAHESKDPLLHKLAGSLDNMTSSFSNIGQKFKSGKFDNRDVDTLNNSYNTVDGNARSANLHVKDVQVAVPGN